MKEINSYGFNMAEDPRKVRVEERLKIKIGEAKNLPARSYGVPSHRDPYCVLSLDQEEIFRTSTIERTLNPFFAEEFQFEVPRRFRYLSIYVFDRDKHLKQDKVLGKVAIKREDLQSYNNKDHWFVLRAVDADSEVQGKAHIEILFEDSKPMTQSPQKPSEDSNQPISELWDNRIDPTLDTNQQNVQMQYMRSSKQDLRIAEDLTGDRKSSKIKNLSKNLSDYYKESMKFGSCSSSSSRRLLSATGFHENSSNLSRSESLKDQNQPIFISHTYGPASGFKSKQLSESIYNQINYQNTFIDDVQVSPDLEIHRIDSAESNSLVPEQERHYVNIDAKVQIDLRNKFSVRVLECSELTTKNGQCDPYALVTVVYSNGKRIEKKTKVKKKTVNPRFDECFVFDLTVECDGKDRDSSNAYTVCTAWGEAEVCECRVSLWHDGGTAPAFLGVVKVPLRGPQQKAAVNNDAWYFLTSRSQSERSRGATPPGTRLSAAGPASALGSLRLHLRYTVDHVFPLKAYEQLNTLFIKSVTVKPITASAVYILGEIVSSKTDAAQPLVRLFTHHDLIVPIVKALADSEISALTDATTIFRGNTLVSKMMDEAMRLTGIAYLYSVLRPTLTAVLSEKKPCEIDPARVKERAAVEVNLTNLKDYVERVFAAITVSYGQCPPMMCRLFDALRQCAARHFPRNAEVRYSVVSGFIFLRFFAPAILGPRLFNLTTEQIDPQTNRTLTLISKTIQSLGNLVSSRSAHQVCKEEYMAALYRSFCTERHVQAIKQFLEIISTGRETQNNNIQETPILLKEGTMIKRSEYNGVTGSVTGTTGNTGRRRWGRVGAAGKRRHFRLTSGELSWSRSRGKPPVKRLSLNGVLAVTSLDAPPGAPQQLGAENMFQIVHHERTLYVQAGNCVERAEWLRLLEALCRTAHHPLPYQNGKWTCCGNSLPTAPGCGTPPCIQSAPASFALHLDPARDLQRLHCLLYSHTSELEKRMIMILGTRKGNQTVNLSPLDEASALEVTTLKELQDAVFSLEDRHRVYQRSLARETKYGSKQAPIGDDNYLHLAARSNVPLEKQNVPSIRPYQHLIVDKSPLMVSRDTSLSPCRPFTHPRPMPTIPSISQSPPALPEKTIVSILKNGHESIQEDQVSHDSSNYLKNSLYIASSNESLKVPLRNADDRQSGKSAKSLGANSGYLKMSCLKPDVSEDSDSSSKAHSIVAEDTPPQLPNKTHSEYVDIKPKLPERHTRLKPAPKLPPKDAKDKIVNQSLSCKEYELMADFRTCAARQLDIIDVPPAIPPRVHLTNTGKRSSITISPDNLTAIIMSRDSSLRIIEQAIVDIKNPSADYLGNISEVLKPTIRRSEDTPEPASKYENSGDHCSTMELDKRKGEICIQKFSVDFDSACELPTESNPSSNINKEYVISGVTIDDVVDAIEKASKPKNEKRVEHEKEESVFSRKSVQRKSIPTKSQPLQKSIIKTSSSTSNVKDVGASSKSGFADRLTPFFLKKRPKPSAVASTTLDEPQTVPPKPPKKDDNLLGRLTPRFGQSRLYGRGQSLDLASKATGSDASSKKGIERSATSIGIPSKSIAVVGNLKNLNITKEETPHEVASVDCHKFVRNDSFDNVKMEELRITEDTLIADDPFNISECGLRTESSLRCGADPLDYVCDDAVILRNSSKDISSDPSNVISSARKSSTAEPRDSKQGCQGYSFNKISLATSTTDIRL